MFPPRFILLAVCGSIAARSCLAVTGVDSTFLNRPTQQPLYSDPANWSPPEVPNNTADRLYNVTIGPPYFVHVDIAATISNLLLPSSFPGLIVEKNLTVAGTTQNQMLGGSITVQSGDNLPATFKSGSLSSYLNGALFGSYSLIDSGAPATLQFNGARIATLSGGRFTLFGPLARIVDQNGVDALSSLARIDANATLALARSLVTNAPFKNDGSLVLFPSGTPTAFTATVGLVNFNSSTRTLTGGDFQINSSSPPGDPVELRFPGADIVNLASSLLLSGPTARIADLAGNDALRNLARIFPAGFLTVADQQRAIPGLFQNDGVLSLVGGSVVTIGGALTNFDPTTFTLTGGSFFLRDSAQFRFPAAFIERNAATLSLSDNAAVTDSAGNNALGNFNDNLAAGKFVVGNNYQFNAPGDFTNAGQVETAPPVFRTREFLRAGIFVVPAGYGYAQTGGMTTNNGFLIADPVDILAGTFTGKGTVQGNLTIRNATYAPAAETVIQGNLTLTPVSHFHYQLDFNAPKNVTGKVLLAGTLEVDIPSSRFVASNAFFPILQSASPLSGRFSNAPDGARIPTTDGKGSVVVVYGANYVAVAQYHAEPTPVQLLNISSRAFLSNVSDDAAGDRSVLIGGFIIVSGSADKKDVVVRGLGPSLAQSGLSPVLADPILELRAADGTLIASNDDWKQTQANELLAVGLAPRDDHEAALRATLSPGAYSVVVRNKPGLAGHGLVEIYDVTQTNTSKLANISTRGFTSASTVLIGGIISGPAGQAPGDFVVRALGPSLKQNGIVNALDDPTLEVRNANGFVLGSADDSSQGVYDTIAAAGLAPPDKAEPAMYLALPGGNYTAIVRAKGDSAGVALVEVYDLRR